MEREDQFSGETIAPRTQGVGSIELWDEVFDVPAANLSVLVIIGPKAFRTMSDELGVVAIAIPPGKEFQVFVEDVHKLEDELPDGNWPPPPRWPSRPEAWVPDPNASITNIQK